jgi:hypothetical protein
VAACQKGYSVAFTTAAALVHELMEARDERRQRALQKHLNAVKLLIVDELDYVPITAFGSELLFEVFSHRYERGSTLVTSNWPSMNGHRSSDRSASRTHGLIASRITFISSRSTVTAFGSRPARRISGDQARRRTHPSKQEAKEAKTPNNKSPERALRRTTLRSARLNARCRQLTRAQAALFYQPDWHTFTPPSGTLCLRR